MINRTPALVAASLNLGLDIFGRQWGEYRLERDVMPCLLTTKTEAWMTTVMADDQHTDCVFTNDAKQDSVWETVHETTAHTALDNGVLKWTYANSFDG
jgi:hypothetical protein